ncbi:hypothetical protein EDB81DRAFT_952433 [Dactylonectria macrodidyma]|uniref:Peptidase S8/S53 domain-containing protein n=1 Tax=Dactylonectria macrodidyma TaxID=307937 RepID=A0A9P9DKB8_9HYPO|nr:hypothetical protein EDB81DRAFT_952433 [Dactylonectria macrodidyma]
MALEWDPDDGFEDEFDPEVVDDIQAKREENYEERFRTAGKTIKRRKYFTQDDVDEFFAEFDDIAGKSSAKISGNLLHTLVEIVKHSDEIESEHVELLVRGLVGKYPDLLKYSNQDGHNPVFMAVRAANHQLVSCMISACEQGQIQEEIGLDFMQCLDDSFCMKAQEGKTCLHIALKENFNPTTTRMMIENASDEALAVQDDLGKTPMHYAVTFSHCTDIRADLISLFIQRDLSAVQSKPRPKTTFLDLTDKSNYSVFREHQKSKIIITKKFNDWTAKKAQSTSSDRTDEAAAGDRTAHRGIKETLNSRPSERDAPHAVAKPNRDEIADKNPGENKAEEKLSDREKLRQKKKAEEAIRLREAAEPARRDMEPAPNTPIKRINSARVDGMPSQSRPPARPSHPSRKTTTADKGNMTIWNKNSKEILLSLKLHYMRTRSAEMAISFLYGSNMSDIQIGFDYDRLPRRIFWNDFIKRFGADERSGLKFDSVLNYVTFPQVEVRLKGRLADNERDAELQSGGQLGALGRKDMTYFFDWLYKKGVRHIIRLSVQDSGDSGEKIHSDQAIQQALERFVVERLDWQKTDLDPETILHVGSKASEVEAPTNKHPKDTEMLPNRQLKELSLRWSGSNAVLRAWSEPEGLPSLTQLEKIYLFKPPLDKVLDSPRWINQKVHDFQERLNRNSKEIDVAHVGSSEQGSQVPIEPRRIELITRDAGTDDQRKATSRDAPLTTSAPVKGVNSHRWLDSTSRFASEMMPFWESTLKDFKESRKGQGTPERVEDDVVIALIDDGIDTFDSSLSNHVLEGKSFDYHDGKVRPPFSSARGHGTVMASMILRICPMAKVYPIRLRTYDGPDGKNQIDRKYAALAVQAALDKKATIISMSWTLPMPKGSNGVKDTLHTVLQKAVENKVLMFCSSPDEGKFSELDYPSGPWPDDFFRIGAARADGTVFEWTQDDGITFVLPGVDVVKDQVGNSSFDMPSSGGVTNRVVDFKYETGSSVATALAAGLAAMVIYCVKASILAVKTANQNTGPIVGIAIPDNGGDLVARPDAMRAAFRSLGKKTHNNFIQVWEELDKISDILERTRARGSSPEAKLACIKRFVEFGVKLAQGN